MSVGIVTRVIKKLSQLLDVDTSSAATGSSLIYNGSGWTTLKHNFAGTTVPGVGDDSADGYAIGSLWFDLTISPNEIYRCLDATEGAAVWVNTSLEVGELGALAILDTINNTNWSGTALAVANGGTGVTTLNDILTLIGKATASGLASLNASSLVVQDPANATATPTASKIPIADASGLLDSWISGLFGVTTHDATENVTTASMNGGVHLVTGAYTLSLPTAAVGYSARFIATTAAAFSLDLQTGTDVFYLNQTALTAGNKVTTDGTIRAEVYVECAVAGYYEVTVVKGTAADGGA